MMCRDSVLSTSDGAEGLIKLQNLTWPGQSWRDNIKNVS
jgi:hypothetical protein